MNNTLRLYLVMGSQNCKGNDPVEVLREAIAGGISLFQFREKGANARIGEEKTKLALTLKETCHQAGIPFIVNDDVELALAIDADGIHIGQEDGSIALVRKKMAGKIMGVSCHNVEEALEAVRQGADYLGVGPMFFTATKEDIQVVQGPVVIQEIRNAGVELPIVGIGGINQSNASGVLAAGADGVAVISAITHASSPLEAAKELKDILKVLQK